MTPRPLLTARARPMCHPAGSCRPGDLGREAEARAGRMGAREGPWGFRRRRRAREPCERAAARPGERGQVPSRVTCGRRGARVSACTDVSLRGPRRLPLPARSPRPRPPPPEPWPHEPGHAERQTEVPRRPRAGLWGGARQRGPSSLAERSTGGGALGEGG